MPKAQLTGPCSLCGAKRSSSSWRRLPECTNERAGQAACNACYVSVAKQAREDVAGVAEAVEARCALRSIMTRPGVRKCDSPSKGKRSASSSELQSAELPCTDDGLNALLDTLEDGHEASLAASMPPRSPIAGKQFLPAPGSSSGAPLQHRLYPGNAPAAAATSESAHVPLRRSARKQQQQWRQQRAHLPSLHTVEVQPPGTLSPTLRSQESPLGSPAMSLPLPAARLVAAQPKLLAPPALEEQQRGALQQMFSTLAGTPLPPAAEQALLTVRCAASGHIALAGVLPSLELLLPGAGLAPLPVGALLISAQLPPPHGTALLVVVHCPRTGQLLRCREWLRQEDGRLYLHPCRQVVAWDSSEGWKLLFPELQEGGPQSRLFKAVVARFGAWVQPNTPQPPILVDRITFPDLDSVADTLPGPLSSPSAATAAADMAVFIATVSAVAGVAGGVTSGATATAHTTRVIAVAADLATDAAVAAAADAEPAAAASPALAGALLTAPTAPAAAACAAQPGRAAGQFGEFCVSCWAAQLGGITVLSPPAGGSQGAADCKPQLFQRSLAERLGVAPMQPPPQMPLPWMPAQQHQHQHQHQLGRLQWQSAAEAQVSSPAGLLPPLAGSLGSQGHAGSGHGTAAAPAHAPAAVSDHAQLEGLDFGCLEDAAILGCLAGGELDGLLDCLLEEDAGSAAGTFEF